jgi:very-short-patch-repair endonuclease
MRPDPSTDPSTRSDREPAARARFPPRVAENVRRLAQRQGGHATRTQLLAAGVPSRTIDRWIAHRRLIRVYRGVYAVGHLQSNPINAAHAALLAGGPRSALAGVSALVLWGVWRHWPKRFEIVIAENRRPSGLIVHHSTTLTHGDVKVVQGLRVTSPARMLLDTAPRLTEDQLAGAINELRFRGLLTLEQLEDVIARNPNHPSVTLLRPHLEFAQPEPTRSWLEDKFLPLLRRHGLPTPQINVPICGYPVDAYFADHNLIVELDGWRTHGTKYAFVEDRHKDAEILAKKGIPTVRFPHEDVIVNGTAIPRLIELFRRPIDSRSPQR